MEKHAFWCIILLEKHGGFMFYRKIQSVLEEYYIDKSEPILVINGARQIGKTYECVK